MLLESSGGYEQPMEAGGGGGWAEAVVNGPLSLVTFCWRWRLGKEGEVTILQICDDIYLQRHEYNLHLRRTKTKCRFR
jgi:hypothetical protein